MAKSLPSTLLGLFCIAATMNQAFGIECYHCIVWKKDGSNSRASKSSMSYPNCTVPDVGSNSSNRLWNEVEVCPPDRQACHYWETNYGGIQFGCQWGNAGNGSYCHGGGDSWRKYVCDTGDLCNIKEPAKKLCAAQRAADEKAEREERETDEATENPKNPKNGQLVDDGRGGAADKSSSWNFLASIVFLTGFLQIGGIII